MKATKFSVLIDESNKLDDQKYLHILVKLFNDSDGEERTHFYKAIVCNQTKSNDIIQAINDAFIADNIPWCKVLQIMSNSPNVMRGKDNGVIAQKKSKFVPNILDIGGCSLHHIHNAVSYATSAFGEEIENFAIDTYSFFKHRTGLCEEFENIQALLDVAEYQILQFVSKRRLSIRPVVERLIEQWVPLVKFFKDLTKTHPDVSKQDRTKRIVMHLSNLLTHIKMLFLKCTLVHFERFEKLFQAKDTKIHILHLEMIQLVRNVMALFVQPSKLKCISTVKQLTDIKFTERDNQLTDDKIFIGVSVMAAINDADSKLKETKKNFFSCCQVILYYSYNKVNS